MKNKIVLFITIIVCFLLQCTIMDYISIGSITPNLPLILCVAMGLMRGRKVGLWTGFFSGLFNKVQEGVSTATANVENVLNNFIEALAILLVTSCLIPILVLIFFVWLVKMLLGLNIDIPTSVRK